MLGELRAGIVAAYTYDRLRRIAESRGTAIPPPSPFMAEDAFFRADVKLWLGLDELETQVMLTLDIGFNSAGLMAKAKSGEMFR